MINVMFTSSWLANRVARWLKPYGITTEQFNVLRILRGQYPKPAPLKLITERMIDKNSNTSRIVERLRIKKLVERDSNSTDRRRVDILITQEGLNLLERIDKSSNFNTTFNYLPDDEALLLSDLLDRIRDVEG